MEFIQKSLYKQPLMVPLSDSFEQDNQMNQINLIHSLFHK